MGTRPIFKIVGVGGGASIAVDYMYADAKPEVSYALVDTSRFIIESARVPSKLLISPDNRAVIRSARANALATQHAAEIGSLFDDGTEMSFIIAGMGGVTGTGAGPTVARISRERNITTIGIVTVPFLAEDSEKLAVARKGIEEMKKNVDSLIIIDSQKFCSVDPEQSVLGNIDKSNEVIKSIIKDVLGICSSKAITCIASADVLEAFRNGGHAIVASGEASGENRITSAIENARKSPMAADFDLENANRLLVMLYTPNDNGTAFKLKEVELLSDYLSKFPEKMDIIWGMAVDESLADSVRATIIATSHQAPYPADCDRA